MNKVFEKIAALFSIKSLVTLILTIVFAVLALNGVVSQEFMTIYTVVIAFYFGTQAVKDDK